MTVESQLKSIKSEIITDAVSYLCKKAACNLPDDVYKGILELYCSQDSQDINIGEILVNAKLASNKQRPICQDTGLTVVFAEIGQNVYIQGEALEDSINKGVETAYNDFFLRKSVVDEPVFSRKNTKTNTPAVIYTKIVSGNTVKLTVMLKGGGSENMSAVKMLKPYDGKQGIVDFAIETIKKAGLCSCPPMHIGIGIGGTIEYAGLLAKKALLNKVIPISELKEQAKIEQYKALELEILEKAKEIKGLENGIFAVNIEHYSSHIAGLPVAINLNCHAARHTEIIIDDNTIIPEIIDSNCLKYTDNINIDYSSYKKISLPLSKEDVLSLKPNDNLLLSGEILTARDAAHKKLFESIQKGEKLPIDLNNKVLYYSGPCPATENEIIGPIGPTTSGRMDVYTPALLQCGVRGMIGKGHRSPEIERLIKSHNAVYITATGGAACLLAEKVISSEVIAYPELGTEAIYKLKVKDFPVTVNTC